MRVIGVWAARRGTDPPDGDLSSSICLPADPSLLESLCREAREAEAAEAAAAAAARAKTSQRKAAKNFSLISFGDEAEAEEEAAVEAAASLKIASAHDALHDAHLSKEAALDVDLNRRVAGCGCGCFQLL